MTNVTVRASSSGRFVMCPGSVRMGQVAPSLPDSDDALEGKAAHKLLELVLSGEVPSCEEMIDRTIGDTGVIVTGDMARYIQPIVDDIRSRDYDWLKCEQSVPFSTAPTASGNNLTVQGTTDVVSYNSITRTLYIDDLKYGFHIVEAPGNWQMVCYAIGAAIQLLCGPNGVEWPTLVVMTIHQPRPYHEDGKTRSWSLPGNELRDIWFAYLTNTVADQVNNPGAACVTGPHCRHCTAVAGCPAHHRASMNAVDTAMAGTYLDMPDTDLGYELDLLDRAEKVLSQRREAVQEVAIARLREGGHAIPSSDGKRWELKQGIGQSVWKDDTPFDKLTALTGITFDEPKKITPAEAIRRGMPETMRDRFTHRPSRGLSLARVDANKKANQLFGGTQ